jgi:hypothetical protein
MTDIVYERAAAREVRIWDAFQFNGPFGTIHFEERGILMGLYANTYFHGHGYLKEIETEDLARLVDTYNSNMAMLTNEEARTVLEIAAKRYVENLTQQIHETDMITRQQKISALDDEYDAREAALDADREALVTKRAEVQLAWDRANQKIKDLEMRTELEGVNYQLVEVDIAEQELKAARADLAVIEAGLAGLDIQLAITQTGIDITNTDLQITQAENEVDGIGIRVSETEVQASGVDLDIVNSGIALSKARASGERTKVDMEGVAVRVAETDLETAETEAKEFQMDAEISGIEADTAKLALVDSELSIAQSGLRVAAAENALLVQERYLIESRGDNVTAETAFIVDQQTSREELDTKTLEHDQSEHDAEIEMSRAETDFGDNVNDIKVDALDQKKDLADNIKETKVQDADDRTELDDIRADAAEEYAAAAIAAAQQMASADIMNTLKHSIG